MTEVKKKEKFTKRHPVINTLLWVVGTLFLVTVVVVAIIIKHGDGRGNLWHNQKKPIGVVSDEARMHAFLHMTDLAKAALAAPRFDADKSTRPTAKLKKALSANAWSLNQALITAGYYNYPNKDNLSLGYVTLVQYKGKFNPKTASSVLMSLDGRRTIMMATNLNHKNKGVMCTSDDIVSVKGLNELRENTEAYANRDSDDSKFAKKVIRKPRSNKKDRANVQQYTDNGGAKFASAHGCKNVKR